MIENPTKPSSHTKTKLLLDILIFTAFLIAMEPHASGLAIHERLSLSASAAVIIHLLLNWEWISQLSRRFLGKVNGVARISYLLNWALFIDAIMIMLSGIMISEIAMPTLGISLGRNFAWRSLHDQSANIFLVLLGLHTALHWGWVVNAFKRDVFQPITQALVSRSSSKKDVIA